MPTVASAAAASRTQLARASASVQRDLLASLASGARLHTLLHPAPARPPLTELAWQAVERALLARAWPEHGAFAAPAAAGGVVRRLPTPELTTCPICLSAYGTRRQACLLECSHVFHGGCLRQLVAFAAAAAAAGGTGGSAAGCCPVTCPLCRRRSRSTCATLLPGAAALHGAAVAVQAAARGWLDRRRFWRAYTGALRQQQAQSTAAMAARRPPRFIAAALSQAAADAVTSAGRARAAGMAAVLASADASLGASRSFSHAAAARLRAQGGPQLTPPPSGNNDDAAVSALLQRLGSLTAGLDASIASLLASAAAAAPPVPPWRVTASAQYAFPLRLSAPLAAASAHAAPADWDALLAVAVGRGHLRDDCAICAAPLLTAAAAAAADASGGLSWTLPAPDAVGGTASGGSCLLPCGHALHAACVGAYERFMASTTLGAGGGGAAVLPHRCPLCRQGYEQRVALVAG
jgi:hypothetical protein